MKKKKEKVWREKPARKKFVKDQVDILVKQFFLEGWDISIDYFKEPNIENPRVDASVDTDWNYRRFQLKIFPPFWNEPEEERKKVLLHEFCHVIITPIFVLLGRSRDGKFVTLDELEDVKEHVTCWIEQICSAPKK